MYCKNCKREIPEEAAFCPYCGYAVYEDDVREIEEGYMSERRVRNNSPREPKKNNTILVAVLALVALALFGLLLYVGASMIRSVRSDNSQESKAVTAESTATEKADSAKSDSGNKQQSGNSSVAAAPSSTPSPTVTPLPTPTPFPTAVPTATPTPIPTPSPTEEPPAPTATPVPQNNQATNNYYMISSSSSQYLSEESLYGLSEWQLKIARNEIYARHGRRFKDPDLQAYFDSQAWYSGTISPDNFDVGSLSSVEVANATLIRNYEHRMGYNGQ